MADCSASAASEAIYPLEFISSKGRNIPVGQQASGVCYSEVQLPGTSETRSVLVFGQYENVQIGNLTIKKPVYVDVTYNKPGETISTPHAWRLSGFNIEAKGKLKVWWRNDGHLMVTAYDIYSTLTGTDGDTGRILRAPGYFVSVGWALNAMAAYSVPQGVPADNDPDWRFCLGGWWSAPTMGCGYSCPDAYGNPAGGTMYNWNKWTGTDAKFAHNGETPGRTDGPIEWDLGVVEPSESLGIYLYARGVRGYCGSQYFDPKVGARQALAFAVPMPKLCPPEITNIEAMRDICEEKVWADVTLDIPELGGRDSATLEVVYAIDQNFSNPWTTTKTVNGAGTVTVRVEGLVPRTKYWFKARLKADRVESDYSPVLDALMPFMPKPEWVVPMLSQAECEKLTEGDCIDELTADNIKPLQCEEYRKRM